MRRKALVLLLAFGAALALTAVAYAGNGGFAPATPHSPNAQRINDSYLWISIFTGAIFVLVEGALILFIVKYRRRGRPRSQEGPQIHGATRLELIWTAIPVVILAVIAAFIFYKLPGIQDVPSAKAEGGPLVVRVDAHQFYWQFTYPDGQISIDELHAPLNRTVRVDITSQDVDHSWWIPELGGKFDAIPGHMTHTWFKADRAGTYRGQCGEFCGVLPRGDEGCRRGAVADRSTQPGSTTPRHDPRQRRVGRLVREVPRAPGTGRFRADDLGQHPADAAPEPRGADPTGSERDAAGRERLVGRAGAGVARYLKQSIYKRAASG